MTESIDPVNDPVTDIYLLPPVSCVCGACSVSLACSMHLCVHLPCLMSLCVPSHAGPSVHPCAPQPMRAFH